MYIFELVVVDKMRPKTRESDHHLIFIWSPTVWIFLSKISDYTIKKSSRVSKMLIKTFIEKTEPVVFKKIE